MTDQSINLATGATTLGDLGVFTADARKIGLLRDVSVGSCVLTNEVLLRRFERKSAREIARTSASLSARADSLSSFPQIGFKQPRWGWP